MCMYNIQFEFGIKEKEDTALSFYKDKSLFIFFGITRNLVDYCRTLSAGYSFAQTFLV